MEPSSLVQKTQQPRNQADQIGKTIKRGEGIEKGVFIENEITCIQGSKPAEKKNKNKQSYMKEIRRQKREQEARKRSGHQLGCLALQNSRRKRTPPPPRY